MVSMPYKTLDIIKREYYEFLREDVMEIEDEHA